MLHGETEGKKHPSGVRGGTKGEGYGCGCLFFTICTTAYRFAGILPRHVILKRKINFLKS